MSGPTGAERLLRARLHSQLLAGEPAPDPLSACRHLLAVQAQDPRAFRLAIRARSAGGSVAALERELNERRSMIVSTLNRGTLHLVSSEDFSWLHAVTTPPLHTASARRLAQEGVSPAAASRAVALIGRWLGEDGPLPRGTLRERLRAAGIRTDGQAFVHILLLASLHGVAVRGPMMGSEHAYVLVEDWLGPFSEVDRDRALGELARRYLAGHAPAGERDLARWAGLPLRDARAGLRAIARELVQRSDGLLELALRAGDPPPLPAPRLLGAFEPLLLGWISRGFVTGSSEAALVQGGIFRPFALVRGRAAAAWRLQPGRIALEPLADLGPGVRKALERDGERVLDYLGLRPSSPAVLDGSATPPRCGPATVPRTHG